MKSRQFAIDVTKQLQDAGYQALWAGGCVRDDLLGIEPSDFDVATNATPKEVRKLFGYKRTLSIGAAFGVITVLGPKPVEPIEIATFRKDGDYSDGRHPDSVEFSDAQHDALRRDFTINGMFFDPIKNEVIDFVGGQDDLRLGQVRAIGNPDQRIDEDKLRMLRAVRFAARFGYSLESETFQSVVKHRKEILRVSGERIAAEFQKMLQHPNRCRAVELLQQTKLFDVLLPEMSTVFDDQQKRDNLYQILQADGLDFSSALARLVYQTEKPFETIARVGHDWRLSNHQVDQATFILQHEQTIRNAHDLKWSAVQPTIVHQHFQPTLAFARDLVALRQETRQGIEHCMERQRLPSEELDPPHLIDGNDLKQLGIAPGPIFKQILESVRNGQLDSEITNRDEAIELAQQLQKEAAS